MKKKISLIICFILLLKNTHSGKTDFTKLVNQNTNKSHPIQNKKDLTQKNTNNTSPSLKETMKWGQNKKARKEKHFQNTLKSSTCWWIDFNPIIAQDDSKSFEPIQKITFDSN